MNSSDNLKETTVGNPSVLCNCHSNSVIQFGLLYCSAVASARKYMRWPGENDLTVNTIILTQAPEDCKQ